MSLLPLSMCKKYINALWVHRLHHRLKQKNLVGNFNDVVLNMMLYCERQRHHLANKEMRVREEQ